MPRKQPELDIAKGKTPDILLSIGEKSGAYIVNNINLVRRYVCTTPNTACKTIKLLSENGLINKEQLNGRTSYLSLTKKGEKVKWHIKELRNLLRDSKVVQSG